MGGGGTLQAGRPAAGQTRGNKYLNTFRARSGVTEPFPIQPCAILCSKLVGNGRERRLREPDCRAAANLSTAGVVHDVTVCFFGSLLVQPHLPLRPERGHPCRETGRTRLHDPLQALWSSGPPASLVTAREAVPYRSPQGGTVLLSTLGPPCRSAGRLWAAPERPGPAGCKCTTQAARPCDTDRVWLVSQGPAGGPARNAQEGMEKAVFHPSA